MTHEISETIRRIALLEVKDLHARAGNKEILKAFL